MKRRPAEIADIIADRRPKMADKRLTQDPDQVTAPSAMTEEQLVVAIENRISGRCGLRIQ